MEKELIAVELAEEAVFDFLLERYVFSSIDGPVSLVDYGRLKDSLEKILSLLKTINSLLVSYGEYTIKGYKNNECKILQDLVANFVASVEKDLGGKNE